MRRTLNDFALCCLIMSVLLAMMVIGGRVAEGAVSTYLQDGERHIVSDGLPDHATGQFPNRHNPNEISAQRYHFRMPVAPRKTERITWVDGYIFGVGLNGIPFDPATAEQWDPETGQHRRGGAPTGWRYEAITGPHDLGLDHNHAHVQPDGSYHYHGTPNGLIHGHGREQIGWAADGFPIFYDPEISSSYRLRGGARPAGGPPGDHDGAFTQDWIYVDGVSELDECNGMAISDPNLPEVTYGYFVTDNFPFISRCFVGIPHHSFKKQRGETTRTVRRAIELRPSEARPVRVTVLPPRPRHRRW